MKHFTSLHESLVQKNKIISMFVKEQYGGLLGPLDQSFQSSHQSSIPCQIPLLSHQQQPIIPVNNSLFNENDSSFLGAGFDISNDWINKALLLHPEPSTSSLSSSASTPLVFESSLQEMSLSLDAFSFMI